MSDMQKKDYWSSVVGAYLDTGLSAREYCRQEALNYQMFLRWKRKLQENSGSLHFSELFASRRMSLSSGSLAIEVDSDLDISSLSNVIKALCLATDHR